MNSTMCESTADEVSFEWLHHRISSTDSKVRTTLRDSISHSGRLALKTNPWTAAPSPQATQAIENECSAARLSVWARNKEKRCDGWREICVLCHRHGYTRLLFISKSFCARLEIWQMFGVLDINMNKRTTGVRNDKEVMYIHKCIFYWLVRSGLFRVSVRQCWGKDYHEKIWS